MKREWFFIIVVTICVVILSLHETWLFSRYTPQGAVYPLVHGYIPDYYYYLSLMEQGSEGKLLLTTRYTSEHFQPVVMQSLYAAIGFIAGIFHIPFPLMYLGARIFFGSLLLLSGYYLATVLCKNQHERVLAFLLMIAGVPLWFISDGVIGTYGNFWRGLDPLGRASALPHHLAANVLLIFTVVAASKALKSHRIRWIALTSLFGFLTGWTNPASLFAFLWAIGWVGLVRIKKAKTYWPALIAITAVSVIPLVYFSLYQTMVYPLTEFKRIESLWQHPLDSMTYLKIMSISGFFALVAIPSVLKKNSVLWDLIVGWFLWPIIALGIVQYFVPMTNARYIQAAYYIPTSLLAAVGIMNVYRWLNTLPAANSKLIAVCMVSIFAIASLPSFYANIKLDEQNVAIDSHRPAIYASKELMEGIIWLNTFGGPDELVIAPDWISLITPAFSNKRVLLGHPTLTYLSDQKQHDMDVLYAFKDEIEVARVIQTHRVSLIWTDETLRVPNEFAGYRFTPVYTNSLVTYYQVTPTGIAVQ